MALWGKPDRRAPTDNGVDPSSCSSASLIHLPRLALLFISSSSRQEFFYMHLTRYYACVLYLRRLLVMYRLAESGPRDNKPIWTKVNTNHIFFPFAQRLDSFRCPMSSFFSRTGKAPPFIDDSFNELPNFFLSQRSLSDWNKIICKPIKKFPPYSSSYLDCLSRLAALYMDRWIAHGKRATCCTITL